MFSFNISPNLFLSILNPPYPPGSLLTSNLNFNAKLRSNIILGFFKSSGGYLNVIPHFFTFTPILCQALFYILQGSFNKGNSPIRIFFHWGMSHTAPIYPGMIPPPHHPIGTTIGFPTVERSSPLREGGSARHPAGVCCWSSGPPAMPAESPHLPR